MVSLNRFVQYDVGHAAFVPCRRCDPATAAALITGGASVLGNILGFGSSQSANETNFEIARMNAELQRETNAQNYRIFQEQNAWNEEMWNKQNEYNLPENQVARLKAAGVNPAMVFGNGTISEAGTINSQTAPQLIAPQVDAHWNPYQPNLDMSGAVSAYQQAELNNSLRKKYNAEAAHTETLNQFEQRSMDSRLKSLEQIAKGDDYRAEIARMEMQYIQDSYYWRIKQVKNDVTMQGLSQDEMNQKIYGHQLANGLAEIQLAYAPKMNEAQLKQYYATVSQLVAASKLAISEAGFYDVQRLGQIIENGMKGLDYNLQKRTKDYVYDQIRYNTYQMKNEYRDYEVNWWNNTIKGYVPFASGAVVGAGARNQFSPKPVRIKGF